MPEAIMILVLISLGCAWAGWIIFNFAVFVLSAIFCKPNDPCFNGFTIHIPTWMPRVFTPAEIAAVVAHEEGHRALWHVWENLARVCIFRKASPARRLEQEMEADDYAGEDGHGIALAAFLMKAPANPITTYRIERLLRKHL